MIRTRAFRSGRRRQGGVATLEMSLLMLPVLLLAELGVAGGRYAQAQAYATAAAYSAARAASLAADTTQAESAAQSAAQASVQGAGAACSDPTENSHGLSDFTPGGNVTVTVTCQVSYSDLLLLPLPGGVTVSGTAVSPVDLFRVT
jgi:Flp pilus assembly protein TadG